MNREGEAFELAHISPRKRYMIKMLRLNRCMYCGRPAELVKSGHRKGLPSTRCAFHLQQVVEATRARRKRLKAKQK